MPVIPRADVEGVELTPEAIESARQEMRTLRDGALVQEQWTWTVLLSHVIVYLAELRERVQEETN